MNKLIAFVAVAMLSAGANAADKSSDIKFGGDMSQAFNWNNNPTFKSSNGGQEQDWLSKTNFHISAMTSDKLMGYMNLAHTAVWGANGYNGGRGAYTTSTTTVGAPTTFETATSIGADMLHVTEAWLWWKTSDSFSLRAGRQNATYGSGFIMSKNDGLTFPYYFDGLMARWSWDFADLDFGGSKLADAGVTTASGVAPTDVEVVAYAANLGIKTLPDVVKKLDLTVLQVQGDTGTAVAAPGVALPGVSAATGSWNVMDIGVYGMLDFGMIDLGANLVFQSGKQKAVTTGVSDVSYSATAYDVNLGIEFPEFMKARLNVGYHMDSGDDSTTANTYEGYQPLFYDVAKYSVAGIWGMGNLTNINVGLTLHPSDETTYGLNFNMASRTTDKAGAATINAAYGNMYVVPSTVGTDKALATTFGLTAEHMYGHGLSATAGFNYIMLGSYYKPATNTLNTGSGMSLDLGAKYSF